MTKSASIGSPLRNIPTEELLVPLFVLTSPQLPADAVTCIEVGHVALQLVQLNVLGGWFSLSRMVTSPSQSLLS